MLTGLGGLRLTDLWTTCALTKPSDGFDANSPLRLEPQDSGSVFRVVTFPPDAAWWWCKRSVAEKAYSILDASQCMDMSSCDLMMHKTNSLDFAVVIEGEIFAVTETGERLMQQGDTLVQRGRET